MCFYHDDDWTAQVWEATDGPADRADGCEDCGAVIPAGADRMAVHCREYECCRDCDAGYDLVLGPCLDEDNVDGHVFGEVQDFAVCRPCCRVRAAVRAVEEADGCKGASAEPGYGGLREALDPNASDHAAEYAAKVLETHPGIADHLRRLGWEPEAVGS